MFVICGLFYDTSLNCLVFLWSWSSDYIMPALLSYYLFQSDRIAADEDIGKEKEKTTEQVEEETQTQEAKANAQILEMVRRCPLLYPFLLSRGGGHRVEKGELGLWLLRRVLKGALSQYLI